MAEWIHMEMDLGEVRPFRIDGWVYVTFPADGALEAVTSRFRGVTKQSLRLLLGARSKEARRIEQGQQQVLAEWHGENREVFRKYQEEADLEGEENDGKT